MASPILRRLAGAAPPAVRRMLAGALLDFRSLPARLADPARRAEPWAFVHNVGGGDFVAVGAQLLRNLKDHAGLVPTDRVLDIGCGNGRVAEQLAPFLAAGGSYVGFDISKNGIQACRRRFAREPHMRFDHLDVWNGEYNATGRVAELDTVFPAADGSIDLAFATSVFTHMRMGGMKRYLAETARVLAPGGRVAFTAFALEPGRDRSEVFDFQPFDETSMAIDLRYPERAIGHWRPAIEAGAAAAAGADPHRRLERRLGPAGAIRRRPGPVRGGEGLARQVLAPVGQVRLRAEIRPLAGRLPVGGEADVVGEAHEPRIAAVGLGFGGEQRAGVNTTFGRPLPEIGLHVIDLAQRQQGADKDRMAEREPPIERLGKQGAGPANIGRRAADLGLGERPPGLHAFIGEPFGPRFSVLKPSQRFGGVGKSRELKGRGTALREVRPRPHNPVELNARAREVAIQRKSPDQVQALGRGLGVQRHAAPDQQLGVTEAPHRLQEVRLVVVEGWVVAVLQAAIEPAFAGEPVVGRKNQQGLGEIGRLDPSDRPSARDRRRRLLRP